MTMYWTVILPILIGTMSGVGVWTCLWYQRIGWTITLSANIAWVMFGFATGLHGISIGMVLASTAQAHHLWKTRREPFTGRRIPVPRPAARAGRRVARQEIELKYAPGHAPVGVPASTALMPTVEPEPRLAPQVGIACPHGCGRFVPSDLVRHLECNRGNPDHWAVFNRG